MSLKSTVIDGGYCVGCGACAIAEPSAYVMEWNRYGMLQANFVGEEASSSASTLAEKVCPFSDFSVNETIIGEKLFGHSVVRADDYIGYHLGIYAGHVTTPHRERSTSGGVGRTLAAYMLDNDIIDYHITVDQKNANDTKSELFGFRVFQTKDEVLGASRAAYYPLHFADVVSYIKSNEGRYSITALPCSAKALRLLQSNDLVLKKRLKFIFGIICGGLKTANYVDFIANQYVVKFSEIDSIDFRFKLKDKKSAREQASHIIGTDLASGQKLEAVIPNSKLMGLDYGMGLFKPKACDYCDDIVGETADISIGDAWLPEYEADAKGDSIVVVRNRILSSILELMVESGDLELKELTSKDVFRAQEAGFRHRRDGLKYRLNMARKSGLWVPTKRMAILPGKKISKRQRAIFQSRSKISSESHERYVAAVESDSFEDFLQWVSETTLNYKALKKENLFIRAFGKLQVKFFLIFKR
jgi:coenzyme F420 hydrogenase subunit beta